LDAALGKVMTSPQWTTAAERNLWTADYKDSKDVEAFLVAEDARLGALLKELGLTKK
jgi:tripartite-type tricarboxylate transporter receptor subunit TctC